MYRLLQEKVSVAELIGLAAGEGHEGIAKTVKNAKEGYDQARGKNTNGLKTYSYSSAAAAASKLIAVFPVLTSRTVSKDTTQMVSKYIEQKGCVILQLALQAANISNAKNGMDYLRNFHQNLNIGGSGVDVLGKMIDQWIAGYQNDDRQMTTQESVSMHLYKENVEDEFFDDSAVYESDNSVTLNATQMNDLLQLFKEAEDLVFYDTKLNPISINDYIVNESAGDYHVSIRRYPVSEVQHRQYNYRKDETEHEQIMRHKEEEHNAKMREYEARARRQEAEADKNRRDAELKDRQTNDRYEAEMRDKQKRADREDEKYERDTKDYVRKEWERTHKANVSILKDQDIKKMNGAVPSLLIVKFYSSTEARVSTEFIIGVKSKVVGCNSDEILRRIANDNKDSKGFLNLIRALTGELKMGDLIFGLSRINDDLKSVKKKGAQGDTWALLQNRAMAAKEAVKRGGINDFAAITTVVISKEDAEELFREENMDVLDPKAARHFMQSYNLLGFIVADDSTESLHMMFDDGDNYFEEVSYMSLERETENGTYKKLINLMATSR